MIPPRKKGFGGGGGFERGIKGEGKERFLPRGRQWRF